MEPLVNQATELLGNQVTELLDNLAIVPQVNQATELLGNQVTEPLDNLAIVPQVNQDMEQQVNQDMEQQANQDMVPQANQDMEQVVEPIDPLDQVHIGPQLVKEDQQDKVVANQEQEQVDKVAHHMVDPLHIDMEETEGNDDSNNRNFF